MANPQLYYTSLTDYGLEAVQKASFMSLPLNITHLAIGDSAGSYYEPSGDMSALKGEKYRGEINRIYQDDKNPSLMIFEAIIPHTSGGYTIREAGLFDEDGKLFAIAKLAETVKPESSEGEAKELYIRLIIEISNAANITFNMNSSAVFATHEWSHENFAPIAHIDDFDNPHKVTTEQIGAATATTVNNHINDKNNPHRVTAAQVGAWTKEENKRIHFHSVNKQVTTSWSLNKAGDPHRERGVYAQLKIPLKFKKSKCYITGTYVLGLSANEASFITGGISIYVNESSTAAVINSIFHNTMKSAITGDYAGFSQAASIPSFTANTTGELSLKVTARAGMDAHPQFASAPGSFVIYQLNLFITEVEEEV